jgi:hypothetical protein
MPHQVLSRSSKWAADLLCGGKVSLAQPHWYIGHVNDKLLLPNNRLYYLHRLSIGHLNGQLFQVAIL